MSSLPNVYTHSKPRKTLLPILTKLLPYSLPLLRRIQFHFQSPHAAVLSTISADSLVDTAVPTNYDPALAGSEVLPAPFAAIYVDRSRAPETESWLFSTAELPSSPEKSGVDIQEYHEASYRHMLALLAHVEALGVPEELATQDDPSALPRDILMLGSLHENNLRLLKGRGKIDYSVKHEDTGLSQASEPSCKEHGNPTEGGLIRGHTIIWLKYIYQGGQESSSSMSTIPEGLEWTIIKDDDVELIIARSPIKRTRNTIRQWAGAALRETRGEYAGKLAAWTFLAADGSLAALHVEERWRRKGLARAVTKRLKAEIGSVRAGTDAKLAFEGVGNQILVHSDTGDYNKSAQALLAGIGGSVGWRVYWAWADLKKAREELKRLQAA